MRKTYGNTWWGKQWLNALNNIDYSNRLPRGRSYANRGMVKEIDIEKNKIFAKVKGSRPRPYKVDLTIPAFKASEKAKIIEMITSKPAFLSRLLNRELPNDLMELCRRAGIHIFPNSWDDMDGGCSCPDWAVPCKHMASVLYLVANEIDKNPFLVFQLHDFDLFKGLEGVGYTAQGQKEVVVGQLSDLMLEQPPAENTFEWQQDVYDSLDFSILPNCKDQLLTLTSEKPVFFPKGDFKKILEKVYKSVSREMIRHQKTEEAESLTIEMNAVDVVEIFSDEELEFQECALRDERGKSLLKIKGIEAFITWIEKIPAGQLHQLAPSVKGLWLTLRLAEKLCTQAAYIPQILRVGSRYNKIRWLPALLNPNVAELVRKVKSLTPEPLLFYKAGKDILYPTSSDAYTSLLSLFINHFVSGFNKIDARMREDDVVKMFFFGSLGLFKDFEDKEYPTAIQLWLNKFFIIEKDYVPILMIDEDDAAGGFHVDIGIEDKTKKITAPITLQEMFQEDEYSHVRLDILRDLSMLSDYFPQVDDLLNSKGVEKMFFDNRAFVNILFKIIPTIELFGIKVLLPKALRKLFRPQVSLSLEGGGDSGAVVSSGLVNMQNMLDFRWQIAVGDQVMDTFEFMKMVETYSGIVKINDQYIYFDEDEIQKLIDKLESPPALNANQVLQAALAEEYEGAPISLDKKARELIDQFLKQKKTRVPKKLKAKLRPYQKSGYEWLYKNTRLGFGSLIADDMGLGKTLQVIATLLKLKEDGAFEKQKALVIVPTTLLSNWEREIAKFAPVLNTHVYHGTNRQLKPLEEADILITTYGVVRSETAKLNKQKWLAVVIDEAQNIKNPATAQTKAVKKIKANVRIAMSGTPVENRLSEYWSIFDFSNKGYLGTLTKFKKEYAKPIEADRDQTKLEHFRKVTQPFILRRLKSDKSIIKDLPDKIEKDQFCELTADQAAVYQSVVENTMETIDEAEGIQRKGLVLKLITALKQICNHPRHFLKKGAKDPALSGKCILLYALLREILDNGEKTLIFTQYQEMGKMLVEMLEGEFGLEIPFLHGGVSRKGRDEMVHSFQNHRNTRILILSLKAGGTGLNLTAASNVIHFDLWWNPAVEAQATDRAYRIGQKSNVMVHRFITKGTFEEKINEILQKKKELANLAVSTGEKWIGEFSDEELKELVKLEP